MKLSDDECKLLEDFFNAGAALVESEPEYWVHGADEGESYCHKCCEKKVKGLLKKDPGGEYCVDGGWGVEGDSTPFCETCGKLLENTLTEAGAETEVDHFLEYGFDPESDDDRRAMSEVIRARGWKPWLERRYRDEYEKKWDLQYFDDLHKVCRTILELFEAGVR